MEDGRAREKNVEKVNEKTHQDHRRRQPNLSVRSHM